MKLIRQSYEILGTPKSLYEAWEFVAKAARNCYQSEKSKPDESEEQFCRRVLLKGKDTTSMSKTEMEQFHLSPFEFGVVYLTITLPRKAWNKEIVDKYYKNPHSKCNNTFDDFDYTYYITTNLRVILENHWESDLIYAGKPTEHHIRSCCFRIITNIGILGELRTHEYALSFTAESTRFCNYSKGKFGGEVTYILPKWVENESYSDYLCIEDTGHWDANTFYRLPYQPVIISAALGGLQTAERHYLTLLEQGWTPQQASLVLPKATKTTIMMCGYEEELEHVFHLRADGVSGPPHPQMTEIMKPMYNDYKQWLSQNEN